MSVLHIMSMLVGVSTAGASALASAQGEWTEGFVTNATNDEVWRYDNRLAVRTGDLVEIQVRRHLLKSPADTGPSAAIPDSRWRVRLQCGQRRYNIVELVKLDAAGAVVERVDRRAETEWRELEPQSMFEQVYEFGCTEVRAGAAAGN